MQGIRVILKVEVTNIGCTYECNPIGVLQPSDLLARAYKDRLDLRWRTY